MEASATVSALMPALQDLPFERRIAQGLHLRFVLLPTGSLLVDALVG